MGRYSYDDMPPEGYRERREGNGRLSAAIAAIGVLLTLIAIILYLLFSPQEQTPVNAVQEEETASPAEAVAEVEPIPAEPEEKVEAKPRSPRIEKASADVAAIVFNVYTVAEGDTLASIAEAYGISPETIVSVNRLTDTNPRPGTELRLPPVDGILCIIAEGDTLSDIVDSYNPELTAPDLAAMNGKAYTSVVPGDAVFVPVPGAIPTASSYIFSSPLPGSSIGARFGELVKGHPLQGVMLTSKAGEAVRAAAAGIVVDIYSDPVFGRSVKLVHDNGYVTCYSALESVSVKTSESVAEGGIIGAIGTSNPIFPEPSVRFSVEQNGVAMDPMNLADL